ncbi:hypothetical protein [Sphingomonas pseudosanguinis]|uniref:Uncharacterized protein n=1 Tax=Sphingomonas pseudosanguinis TaxID=413712 RepID=A0A7W6AE74_9SPHN|nr:hypothetical protein [Sphingomonas pseudosanguinis]MBB3878936.1 hypothetical protein [Sphingomonas pseudosanguinis]MBN3536677.1 hypothetical protein [Sphingomonas pseudosanguinis]
MHSHPSFDLYSNRWHQDLAAFVKSAERIAIRAKIISLSRDVFEKPFAYHACLSTPENKTHWRELSKIAGLSAIPGDRTGDAVAGVGVAARLKNHPALAFGAALLNQFSGQSKDYYSFYAGRILNELALRGIPASSVK